MQIEREIDEIKSKIEIIENILIERLIGMDEAAKDEIKEIEEYEKKKKDGTLELHEI